MKFFLIFLILFNNLLWAHTKLKSVDASNKNHRLLSKETILRIVEEVKDIYSLDFSHFGASLVIELNWENSNPTAFASRNGNEWKVSLNGGLLNHRLMTSDGLTLVICHEIGHHLAGPPYKKTLSGLSAEGQSDYFSTLKCTRKLWAHQDNLSIIKKIKINKVLSKKCLQSWGTNDEYALCVRSGMAALSLGRLLDGDTRRAVTPKFERFDSNVVSKTLESHPNSQCRLDTFLSGSICIVPMTDSLDQNSESVGVCHKSNGHNIGLRPLCWYRPIEYF